MEIVQTEKNKSDERTINVIANEIESGPLRKYYLNIIVVLSLYIRLSTCDVYYLLYFESRIM